MGVRSEKASDGTGGVERFPVASQLAGDCLRREKEKSALVQKRHS